MPDTEPIQSRIVVEKGIEDLKVTIPSRRNWALAGFLSFWLLGWAFGEIFAGYAIVARLFDIGPVPAKWMPGANAVFVGYWLCGWTVGGAVVLYIWLWNLFGREVVTMNLDSVTVTREVPGWSSAKEYRMADVANMRGARPLLLPQRVSIYRRFYGGWCVVFDCEGDIKAFGMGLSKEEAREIVDRIAEAFPQKVAAKRFEPDFAGDGGEGSA